MKKLEAVSQRWGFMERLPSLGRSYELVPELAFFPLGCGRICWRMSIPMNMTKLGPWRISYPHGIRSNIVNNIVWAVVVWPELCTKHLVGRYWAMYNSKEPMLILGGPPVLALGLFLTSSWFVLRHRSSSVRDCTRTSRSALLRVNASRICFSPLVSASTSWRRDNSAS